MATVIIPTPLRKFTNQTARIQVDAGTVGEIIEKITVDYPGIEKAFTGQPGGSAFICEHIFRG